MKFVANCALGIAGDRVAKGQEVELTAEEAARFGDDLTLIDGTDVETPEEEAEEVPLESMTVPQLKEKAAALGLATNGSKADLLERLTLHVPEEETPEEEA